MRIEVIDVLRIERCVAQSAEHGSARAIHIGRGHVAGITAHAKASQFGINTGATRFGVLVFL